MDTIVKNKGLCFECNKMSEITLTSLGATCASCLAPRRARDTTVRPPARGMGNMTDAFFVRSPNGERWVTLLGDVNDKAGVHSTRMMLPRKSHLFEILEAIKNKTYNPKITFAGFDTQHEIMFPILVIKSSERNCFNFA